VGDRKGKHALYIGIQHAVFKNYLKISQCINEFCANLLFAPAPLKTGQPNTMWLVGALSYDSHEWNDSHSAACTSTVRHWIGASHVAAQHDGLTRDVSHLLQTVTIESEPSAQRPVICITAAMWTR